MSAEADLRSPGSFHARLKRELHLQARKQARPYGRVQTLFVMERFLARLVETRPDAVVLKGGLAMELRLARARTTRDVDLRYSGPIGELQVFLSAAGGLHLGDHLTFEVSPDAKYPVIRNPGLQYDSFRFKVRSKLLGRDFQPFPLDVGIGDVVSGEPELVTGTDWLAFAGIPPLKMPVYPACVHVAEKLHAYTFPYPMPNSRVKDLPDIALLATGHSFDGASLWKAIRSTFEQRGTHVIPMRLPSPPNAWKGRYPQMAQENSLPWRTLDEVFGRVSDFLNPVLKVQPTGRWLPDQQGWSMDGRNDV